MTFTGLGLYLARWTANTRNREDFGASGSQAIVTIVSLHQRLKHSTGRDLNREHSSR